MYFIIVFAELYDLNHKYVHNYITMFSLTRILKKCYTYSVCTGELSGPGSELLVRFHTSSEIKKRYTILTHGHTDMIVALLGMLQTAMK